MSGETAISESGWTVDTLKADVQHQIDDMRRLLDERYQTQTKAVDAAFAAAERAVQSALLAAEKAVGKAETAAEKRFESVNEFRGQLNDIVTTLISRTEAEARMAAQSEKLTSIDERMSARLRELESRVDLTQGRSTGLDKGWSVFVAVAAGITAVVAVLVSIVVATGTDDPPPDPVIIEVPVNGE